MKGQVILNGNGLRHQIYNQEVAPTGRLYETVTIDKV